MPAKSKRTLSARENGDELDGSSPAKRLRTEESTSDAIENQKEVESPTQMEQRPSDEEDINEDAIDVTPVPVLDDLYLETVSPLSFWRLMKGKPLIAGV